MFVFCKNMRPPPEMGKIRAIETTCFVTKINITTILMLHFTQIPLNKFLPMKKWSIFTLILLGSVFLFQSCSNDDDDNNMDNQAFVSEAASANMFEIQSAELALDKSDNAAIDTFAVHMAMDHTMATTELMTLAKNHSLTVSTSMMDKHQKMYDQLAAKTGTDFEKSYASMMVTSHQETISLFEEAADHVGETDLRAFAAGKLPTLRTHLSMAQSLNSTVNP